MLVHGHPVEAAPHVVADRHHGSVVEYRIRTNIGEELNLANRHAITKFKSHQYFFYSVSIDCDDPTITFE